MALAKDGWEFVEEGEVYKLKKEKLIAEIKIVKDMSNAEFYFFDFKVLKSNVELNKGTYTIKAKKNGLSTKDEIFNRFAEIGEMKFTVQEE